MSSGSSGMRVTVPEPSRSMFLDFCFMVEMRTGGIRYGGVLKSGFLAVRAYIEDKWTIVVFRGRKFRFECCKDDDRFVLSCSSVTCEPKIGGGVGHFIHDSTRDSTRRIPAKLQGLPR